MKQVDAVKQIHCQKGKGQRSVNLNPCGPYPFIYWYLLKMPRGGGVGGVVLNQYLGI